ncbi:hypothetical protein [Streptomyces sp. NPDC097981]|uniref:hypothetical protein n=1 Tax=Streptomyces sp. NPDC097981 TaxID=3155428 RepID=UPI00332288C1
MDDDAVVPHRHGPGRADWCSGRSHITYALMRDILAAGGRRSPGAPTADRMRAV